MIKGKVYEYLKLYLGEYLYGLNEEQLDVGLLSGNLNFYNANLKPNRVNDLLLSLGLPFYLKAGLIGNLQLKYHYMSWASNPMDVLIDELFLVLGPVMLKTQEASLARMDTYASDEEDPDPFAGPFSHLNLSRSSQSSDETASTAQPKPEEEQGMLQKYFTKVLKNLTLVVRKLHIRFEDETYPYCHPFSFGFTLEALNIRSINSEWSFGPTDEIVPNRLTKDSTSKEIVLHKASFYINPISGMLIPTSLWEETQQSQIGIFEAMPACDVRDLLLHEMEMMLSGASPFAVVQPIDCGVNLVMGSPAISVVAKLPVFQLNFTASMAEAMRSFFEYFTNIQLWGPMRRFRPYERIITSAREPREHRRIRQKRKKIVQKWFHYALKFVKAKQQLITFVAKLRRKNERKQRKQQIKNRGQKVFSRPPSSSGIRVPRPMGGSPMKHKFQPSLASHESSVMSMSPQKDALLGVLGNRIQRPRPGVAVTDISSAVNEYNRSMMQKKQAMSRVIKPIQVQMKQDEVPIDPSKFAFMPSFLEYSSIDIRVTGIQVCYSDEDTRLSLMLKLDPIRLQMKAEPEHLNYSLTIIQTQILLSSDGTEVEIFKAGKREAVVGKENLLNAVFRRQPAKVENVETAIHVTGHYSPTAFRRPGGEFPKVKFHDVSASLSPAVMSYTNSSLGYLLQLYEAFILDKAKRESLADVNSPVQHRESTGRKVQLDVALKRFVLTKAVLQRFIEWQSRLKNTLKEAELEWRDINFSFKVNTAKFTLAFKDGVLPMLDFALPSGDIEFSRVETTTSFSFWGWSVSSSRSLLDLHDYFSVRYRQNLTKSIGKKFKRIQKLFELKPSSI